MAKFFKYTLAMLAAVFVAAFLYGAKGYYDAVAASDAFAVRADALILIDRGGEGLGIGRLDSLLMVQDPGFWEHSGVDLTTPGAGLTTMSQSLSKRLGFEQFQPGVQKIRQTGYALGLESTLSKPQIVALFLDTVEMGHGHDGWVTGFFTASVAVYGREVAALEDELFHRLLAVMIAPSNYNLLGEDAKLAERAKRIERLLKGNCRPESLGDIWLEACG
ncbi:MAG: transglycosylase domain-containing protein [Rhodobiaceae bacterium]|nr:penicillin-binding protein 2D [Rhodobiaceae bacterium]MCR9241006.1 transglycosylase domain-containing protein [Rhodobiaceae bacterium]